VSFSWLVCEEWFISEIVRSIDERVQHWKIRLCAAPHADGTVLSSTPSSPPVRNPRGGGRRPNPARRAAIRKTIQSHGDDWREHLNEIFEALDREEVPLGDFQGMRIELDDGKDLGVSKWSDLDLADGEQRRNVIDSLRKYRDERN
jgi:hypothetical protein